jgi:hypothetical protein
MPDPVFSPPSPAVIKAATSCRDQLSANLDNHQMLDLLCVLLADLVHYTSRSTKPSDTMDYALNYIGHRAPDLLDDAPHT